jgi:hypothetical protein
MGLLLSHKSKVSVYPDMVTVSDVDGGNKAGGGKRGDIQNFSREARKRLIEMMHKIKYERVLFVTLTYPSVFPTVSKVYKAHLKEFRRRFELVYGKLRAFWRLEFQERGAPHFHIMYLDAPFIPVHDLCWLWKCVTKTMDMAHEVLGVDVKLIVGSKEKRLIMSYIAKYISKVDERTKKDDTKQAGRYWGRWNITEETPLVYEVPGRQAELVVAYANLCSGSDRAYEPADPGHCSIFGGSMGSGYFGDKLVEFEKILRQSSRP